MFTKDDIDPATISWLNENLGEDNYTIQQTDKIETHA